MWLCNYVIMCTICTICTICVMWLSVLCVEYTICTMCTMRNMCTMWLCEPEGELPGCLVNVGVVEGERVHGQWRHHIFLKSEEKLLGTRGKASNGIQEHYAALFLLKKDSKFKDLLLIVVPSLEVFVLFF